MPSSVFMRPRARAAMSSVSQQQVFREVHTEDELRSATYTENIDYSSSVYAATGRRIVIASPISIKSPIVINAPGITIESHGKIPIFPASDLMDCIFDASTSTNTVFNNLLIANNLGVQNPLFGIKLGQFSEMTNCSVVGVDTCVKSSFGAAIRGNLLSSYGAVSQISVLIPSGSSTMITGNLLAGDVVAEAGSNNCVISLNCMLGRNIDTSASLGGHTIIGNAGVGIITNTSTDAVTSNT